MCVVVILTLWINLQTLYGLIRHLDSLDVSAVKGDGVTGIVSDRPKRQCPVSPYKPESAARFNHVHCGTGAVFLTLQRVNLHKIRV